MYGGFDFDFDFDSDKKFNLNKHLNRKMRMYDNSYESSRSSILSPSRHVHAFTSVDEEGFRKFKRSLITDTIIPGFSLIAEKYSESQSYYDRFLENQEEQNDLLKKLLFTTQRYVYGGLLKIASLLYSEKGVLDGLKNAVIKYIIPPLASFGLAKFFKHSNDPFFNALKSKTGIDLPTHVFRILASTSPLMAISTALLGGKGGASALGKNLLSKDFYLGQFFGPEYHLLSKIRSISGNNKQFQKFINESPLARILFPEYTAKGFKGKVGASLYKQYFLSQDPRLRMLYAMMTGSKFEMMSSFLQEKFPELRYPLLFIGAARDLIKATIGKPMKDFFDKIKTNVKGFFKNISDRLGLTKYLSKLGGIFGKIFKRRKTQEEHTEDIDKNTEDINKNTEDISRNTEDISRNTEQQVNLLDGILDSLKSGFSFGDKLVEIITTVSTYIKKIYDFLIEKSIKAKDYLKDKYDNREEYINKFKNKFGGIKEETGKNVKDIYNKTKEKIKNLYGSNKDVHKEVYETAKDIYSETKEKIKNLYGSNKDVHKEVYETAKEDLKNIGNIVNTKSAFEVALSNVLKKTLPFGIGDYVSEGLGLESDIKKVVNVSDLNTVKLLKNKFKKQEESSGESVEGSQNTKIIKGNFPHKIRLVDYQNQTNIAAGLTEKSPLYVKIVNEQFDTITENNKKRTKQFKKLILDDKVKIRYEKKEDKILEKIEKIDKERERIAKLRELFDLLKLAKSKSSSFFGSAKDLFKDAGSFLWKYGKKFLGVGVGAGSFLWKYGKKLFGFGLGGAGAEAGTDVAAGATAGGLGVAGLLGLPGLVLAGKDAYTGFKRGDKHGGISGFIEGIIKSVYTVVVGNSKRGFWGTIFSQGLKYGTVGAVLGIPGGILGSLIGFGTGFLVGGVEGFLYYTISKLASLAYNLLKKPLQFAYDKSVKAVKAIGHGILGGGKWLLSHVFGIGEAHADTLSSVNNLSLANANSSLNVHRSIIENTLTPLINYHQKTFNHLKNVGVDNELKKYDTNKIIEKSTNKTVEHVNKLNDKLYKHINKKYDTVFSNVSKSLNKESKKSESIFDKFADKIKSFFFGSNKSGSGGSSGTGSSGGGILSSIGSFLSNIGRSIVSGAESGVGFIGDILGGTPAFGDTLSAGAYGITSGGGGGNVASVAGTGGGGAYGITSGGGGGSGNLAKTYYGTFSRLTIADIPLKGLELPAGGVPDSIHIAGSPNDRNFIRFFYPYALLESAITGIPVSLIIGQAANESAWGRSELATKYHNFFGMKYHPDPAIRPTGPLRTHECDKNGNCWVEHDPFAAYPSPLQSILDHARWMFERHIANSSFSTNPVEVLKHMTGYATEPGYNATKKKKKVKPVILTMANYVHNLLKESGLPDYNWHTRNLTRSNLNQVYNELHIPVRNKIVQIAKKSKKKSPSLQSMLLRYSPAPSPLLTNGKSTLFSSATSSNKPAPTTRKLPTHASVKRTSYTPSVSTPRATFASYTISSQSPPVTFASYMQPTYQSYTPSPPAKKVVHHKHITQTHNLKNLHHKVLNKHTTYSHKLQKSALVKKTHSDVETHGVIHHTNVSEVSTHQVHVTNINQVPDVNKCIALNAVNVYINGKISGIHGSEKVSHVEKQNKLQTSIKHILPKLNVNDLKKKIVKPSEYDKISEEFGKYYHFNSMLNSIKNFPMFHPLKMPKFDVNGWKKDVVKQSEYEKISKEFGKHYHLGIIIHPLFHPLTMPKFDVNGWKKDVVKQSEYDKISKEFNKQVHLNNAINSIKNFPMFHPLTMPKFDINEWKKNLIKPSEYDKISKEFNKQFHLSNEINSIKNFPMFHPLKVPKFDINEWKKKIVKPSIYDEISKEFEKEISTGKIHISNKSNISNSNANELKKNLSKLCNYSNVIEEFEKHCNIKNVSTPDKSTVTKSTVSKLKNSLSKLSVYNKIYKEFDKQFHFNSAINSIKNFPLFHPLTMPKFDVNGWKKNLIKPSEYDKVSEEFDKQFHFNSALNSIKNFSLFHPLKMPKFDVNGWKKNVVKQSEYEKISKEFDKYFHTGKLDKVIKYGLNEDVKLGNELLKMFNIKKQHVDAIKNIIQNYEKNSVKKKLQDKKNGTISVEEVPGILAGAYGIFDMTTTEEKNKKITELKKHKEKLHKLIKKEHETKLHTPITKLYTPIYSHHILPPGGKKWYKLVTSDKPLTYDQWIYMISHSGYAGSEVRSLDLNSPVQVTPVNSKVDYSKYQYPLIAVAPPNPYGAKARSLDLDDTPQPQNQKSKQTVVNNTPPTQNNNVSVSTNQNNSRRVVYNNVVNNYSGNSHKLRM